MYKTYKKGCQFMRLWTALLGEDDDNRSMEHKLFLSKQNITIINKIREKDKAAWLLIWSNVLVLQLALFSE